MFSFFLKYIPITRKICPRIQKSESRLVLSTYRIWYSCLELILVSFLICKFTKAPSRIGTVPTSLVDNSDTFLVCPQDISRTYPLLGFSTDFLNTTACHVGFLQQLFSFFLKCKIIDDDTSNCAILHQVLVSHTTFRYLKYFTLPLL